MAKPWFMRWTMPVLHRPFPGSALMTDYGVMLTDTYIEPKSYLIAALLTAGCYFGSLWLLRRKVKQVDMIESLKDNRE